VTAPAAVLLDFGGTLDADGVSWKDRFRRLFVRTAEISNEEFDRAFYETDDALVGQIDPELSFSETVERLARGVAEKLGLPEMAGPAAASFLGDARVALDRSRGLLERLHARFRIGIVSNFYGNLEAVCRETGLAPHLDAAVDSVRVGAEKPDPRIFEAALAGVGARASEAVFVGDSLPRDMAGARSLGIPHIWLSPGDGTPCCPQDLVIRRLAELEGALS
jgi:putative hydrolase of the HAD superfamily